MSLKNKFDANSWDSIYDESTKKIKYEDEVEAEVEVEETKIVYEVEEVTEEKVTPANDVVFNSKPEEKKTVKADDGKKKKIIKIILISVLSVVLLAGIIFAVGYLFQRFSGSEPVGDYYGTNQEDIDMQNGESDNNDSTDSSEESSETDATDANSQDNENTTNEEPVSDEESNDSSATDDEENENSNDDSEAVANDEEPDASGKCGASVTWKYYESTGKLIISGTGKMTDYEFDNRPWEIYEDNIKKAVIEKGVSSIGKHAFYSCDALESVAIPNSVTSIGVKAFGYCRAITYITIPNSVKKISRFAFEKCNKLSKIIIPDSVTTLEGWVFSECKSLTSVTLSKNITKIDVRLFSQCESLKEIKIPDGVTSIGNYAFYSCTSLESITIPKSVSSIGNYAFDYCASLKKVYYKGASTHWNAILKGSNNQSLTNANIICSLQDPSLALKTNKTELSAGDTVTVTVVLSGNSNLGVLSFDVNYDESALDIESMTRSNLISGAVAVNPNLSSNSARYTAVSGNTINSGGTLVTIKFRVKSRKNCKMTLSVKEAVDNSYNNVTLHTNEINFTKKLY